MKKVSILMAVMGMAALAIGQVQTPVAYLATTPWTTNYVKDEVYGASGRNVGGLVFNGTGNHEVVATLSNMQIGVNDFTLGLRVYIPRAINATTPGLFVLNGSSSPTTGAQSFWGLVDSGALVFRMGYTSGAGYIQGSVANFATTYAGRVVELMFSRTASPASMALYVNGAPVSYAQTTSGTAPGWNGDITGNYIHFGNSGNSWIDRMLSGQLWNYAFTSQDAFDSTIHGGLGGNRSGKFRDKILSPSRNALFVAGTTDWIGVGAGTATADSTDNELDISVAAPGDGVKLTTGFLSSINGSHIHRVEFDVRNNVGSGVYQVKIGSDNVGRFSGNGHYWFEYDPAAGSGGDLSFINVSGGPTVSVANIRYLDIGGLPIITISGTQLINGGFETAGGGGSDVFANWTEAATGTAVISQESTTAGYAGQDVSGTYTPYSAKIVIGGAGTATLTSETILTLQRAYRLSLFAKVDAITGTPAFTITSGGFTMGTIAPTTGWVKYSVDFVAAGQSFVIDMTGSSVLNRTLWLDSVSIEDRGVVLDLDFAVGSGSYAPDRSGNRFHGVLMGGVGGVKIGHALPKSTLGGLQITDQLATADYQATVSLDLFQSGSQASVQGYNHGTSAYAPLNVVGSTVNLKSGTLSGAQVDGNTTAGETRFLLWDVTAGTLKRVSVGAADSGGTGYKVLRVPN